MTDTIGTACIRDEIRAFIYKYRTLAQLKGELTKCEKQYEDGEAKRKLIDEAFKQARILVENNVKLLDYYNTSRISDYHLQAKECEIESRKKEIHDIEQICDVMGIEKK